MRALWGKRAVLSGVAVAALFVVSSCVNFAPAEASEASTVEAARSVDVVFADVTGDGAEDVVVAVALPGEDALVRMAPCGDGCLTRREQVPVGGEVRQLAAADFDGDGASDVAVVTSVEARVYFGGAASPVRPEGLVADEFVPITSEFGSWSHVVAGDFDDDGDADLGLCGGPYEFVAGDGNRGFAPPVGPGGLFTFCDGMATGDVDGDGDAEVLFSRLEGAEGEILFGGVFAYNGASFVASYTEVEGELSGIFEALTAGDIDGDGMDDVAVVINRSPLDVPEVRLMRSTGTGFTGFGPGGAFTALPVQAVDLQLRDLDLDGHTDLLASNGAQLSWWHGFGNGSLAARVDRSAGPGPTDLALRTVGAGPGPDVVVTNQTSPFARVSYLANASQL
jgi:hypothetical protein